MLLFAKGSDKESLLPKDVKEALFSVFDKLGSSKKILAIPPDISRFHSMAGEITGIVYNYYQDKLTDVLPSIGTLTDWLLVPRIFWKEVKNFKN